MDKLDYSEIVITGGLGYLGGRIAEHFRSRGQRVALVGLVAEPEAMQWAEAFDVRVADVTKPETLRGTIRPGSAVIHCASVNQQISEKEPGQSVQVNGLGTFHMLREAAASKARRFVYFSTFHVYGRVLSPEITEETVTSPLLHYGISHLLGELFVSQARAGGLEAVSVRPTNGYGAPAHPWADCWMLALNDFCRSAVRRSRIVLASSGEQRRDFVSIEDIVQAVELLLGMASLPDPVYNVAGDNVLSIRELAHRVVEVARKDYGRAVELEVPSGASPSPPPWVPFRCDLIKRLGYRPQDRTGEAIRALFSLLGWK